MSATWYVVTVTQAMLNPRAVNQVLGMNQFFQGKALWLAEAFAPNADDAVMVFGEENPELLQKFMICFDCFYKYPLAEIQERLASRKGGV